VSYALFLVHFPVILVVSALLDAVGSPSPALGVAGALFAWAASLSAAGLLHRWVEAPAALLHRQLARR
jgi:peptidoglycan/LPS O-acetylase OafA/YrhL